MMPGEPDRRRLSEDERYELAARADMADRRNRPRLATTLAAVALMIAIAALVSGIVSFRAASAEVGKWRGWVEATLRESGRIQQIQAARATGGDELAPVGSLITPIERLALANGMSKPSLPREERTRENPATGLREYLLTYSLRQSDLAATLGWVREVLEATPGMQVKRFEVRPQEQRGEWNIDVVFSRWERPA